MLRYIYYIFYSAAPFFASNAAKKIYFTPLTRGRNSAILRIVNSVHVEEVVIRIRWQRPRRRS
ncbi:hypothetical protein FAEPRAA2165_01542 [Faecalibacterium duncaniae]|uniref:Uncharacterized protein n=1 Tax=Faecalibacterium duncaniae (strain DSM 17677 / JCM 31915 / A2-165) TaxID=411483 RepID=C7H5H1_FAED2|nr:hypothetical protein FAEPRAA2165_01542 [Faecalibacterium duncaniae]